MASAAFAFAGGTCKQEYFEATKLGLARAWWERARGLPEEDLERMMAMECLATALTDVGDYVVALPLMEELLAKFWQMHGDLHSNTLVSVFNLARLHVQMGSLALPLPLAEECLRGYRQTLGEEHEHTLDAMHQLGDVHREMDGQVRRGAVPSSVGARGVPADAGQRARKRSARLPFTTRRSAARNRSSPTRSSHRSWCHKRRG
eukprot:COSAG06_NODE_344_length_17074_cov_116.626510_9_plen_204_part_00